MTQDRLTGPDRPRALGLTFELPYLRSCIEPLQHQFLLHASVRCGKNSSCPQTRN